MLPLDASSLPLRHGSWKKLEARLKIDDVFVKYFGGIFLDKNYLIFLSKKVVKQTIICYNILYLIFLDAKCSTYKLLCMSGGMSVAS